MNDICLSNLTEEQVQSFRLQFGLEHQHEIKISPEELEKREDFRSNLVFAVASRGESGHQQAYSVTQQEDGSVVLGVHVIDASSYIEKDSSFDQHASKRAMSLKLPDRFSRIFPDFIN